MRGILKGYRKEGCPTKPDKIKGNVEFDRDK